MQRLWLDARTASSLTIPILGKAKNIGANTLLVLMIALIVTQLWKIIFVHGEKKEKMPRLINADALADRFDALAYDDWNQGVSVSWADAFKVAADMVRDERIVDAEPIKHGHWIFEPKDAIEMLFTLPKCSECGAESSDGGNYCSNCGAKMDEVEDVNSE